MGSVRSGTSRPSARTSVWKRTPRRAGCLTFPPRSTSVTDPITRDPAGIATWPSAMTSRVTLASTRSSIRARSDEIAVSTSRPITEAAGRTTSRNSGTAGAGGGSGARAGSWTGSTCWLATLAGAGRSGVVGAGAAAGRGSAGAFVFRALDGAGAASRRVAVGVLAPSLEEGKETGAGADIAGFEAAGVAGEDSASALGAPAAFTMASVSETGVAAGLVGAGAGDAATGTGSTTFCRTAIYAPPAAAVKHPAASTPARTLELILTPEQGIETAIAVPWLSVKTALEFTRYLAASVRVSLSHATRRGQCLSSEQDRVCRHQRRPAN